MKIGYRKIEKGQAYVEIGGGCQLAQVYRITRRFRQDGYDVMPLNCGTGDPYGVYTTFIPDAFAHVADMTTWKRLDNGTWRKLRCSCGTQTGARKSGPHHGADCDLKTEEEDASG